MTEKDIKSLFHNSTIFFIFFLTRFRVVVEPYTIFGCPIYQKRRDFTEILGELHEFIDENNFFHISPNAIISEGVIIGEEKRDKI